MHFPQMLAVFKWKLQCQTLFSQKNCFKLLIRRDLAQFHMSQGEQFLDGPLGTALGCEKTKALQAT